MNFEKSKKLVLVVDDSVDNRLLLTLILESYGFSVMCAENGSEALMVLTEMTNLPDLIFLDAQMPIMDGYKFRERQNESERLRTIPVVIMSADSSEEMFERMQCPQSILTKPLRLNAVIERALACS